MRQPHKHMTEAWQQAQVVMDVLRDYGVECRLHADSSVVLWLDVKAKTALKYTNGWYFYLAFYKTKAYFVDEDRNLALTY